MFPLDPKTIDRLVEIAIDRDGAHERTGRQLQQLLEHAAWPDDGYYDGSPKRQWLRDAIDDHTTDREALERLICRLCDPIEYNDTDTPAETAAIFRDAINTLLSPEGLVISSVAHRPVLAELSPNGTAPSFNIPTNLGPRLAALLNDHTTASFLAGRADEASRAEEAGAYTLAVIGIGSFIEGLLAAFLEAHDHDYRDGNLRIEHNGKPQPLNPTRPNLSDLIDAAHTQHWIQLDAKDFLHQVREFRNFIHPRRHLDNPLDFDGDSVMLCWGPVHAVLNDLENSLAARQQAAATV